MRDARLEHGNTSLSRMFPGPRNRAPGRCNLLLGDSSHVFAERWDSPHLGCYIRWATRHAGAQEKAAGGMVDRLLGMYRVIGHPSQ